METDAQIQVNSFHELLLRSGVSAERRRFPDEKFAALCRDAATRGFKAAMRVQKNVEASHEPAWLRVTDPRSGARLCEAQQANLVERSGNYF